MTVPLDLAMQLRVWQDTGTGHGPPHAVDCEGQAAQTLLQVGRGHVRQDFGFQAWVVLEQVLEDLQVG